MVEAHSLVEKHNDFQASDLSSEVDLHVSEFFEPVNFDISSLAGVRLYG